ncbi:hypothetical protein TL16_g13051 [Triparma laevis f. inornata]|uniref:Myosin motor domain-containing protein n=1 Tax=Triparma laevis f. inornata TaxID=1714386 RepID=A0A9W7BR68_9STRA|nr:hypothetical protein TL16_g13051 [Triparma laevis f. inornata]
MSHLSSILPSPSTSLIVKRVLDSNPLLESFGNAKTMRNDNSSRFGKYTQLQFSSGVLVGSECGVYLLEKSRVCGVGGGERGYHVFYQVLDAGEEVKREIGLEGMGGGDFEYVGGEGVGDVIEGETDSEKWKRTYAALQTIGITGDLLISFLKTLSVVLYLGNIKFSSDSSGEGSKVSSDLNRLAGLMEVDVEQLREKVTFRTMTARNDTYKVLLNPQAAKEGVDAFAKELYAKQFLWLVSKINEATSATVSERCGVIGLLDIFGFESFKVNRFEQLCINWCNEKLQQKFTVDVFRSVVQEYESEGIPLATIQFEDNVDVINLIEGRMGAISILNEECVRPKGSDASFVSKLYAMNKNQESDKASAILVQNKRFHSLQFSIQHYAGAVVYDATDFVRKNADTIPVDLVELSRTSFPQIANAFPPAPAPTSTSSRRGSSLIAGTVWSKFRTQLSDLMSDLAKTNTRYIRCIKPNSQKLPHVVDNESTIEQLRCAGVVAAVTISRAAFPNRLLISEVEARFSCLGKVSAVSDLLVAVLGDAEGFEIGATRVYFRTGVLEKLEELRLNKMGEFATKITAVGRMHLARSNFQTMRTGAVLLQALIRCRALESKFARYEVGIRQSPMKAASLLIQCAARSARSRKLLLFKKRAWAATKIRAQYLTSKDLRAFKVSRTAAVALQATMRRVVQQAKFKIALKESKEEKKLENQLIALQKKLAQEEEKRMLAEQRLQVQSASPRPPRPPRTSVDSDEVEQQFVDADGGSSSSGSQHALMHESGKMMEYLRKEVFKIRTQNTTLRTENERLKENNRRLMDANAAAGASFAALNQHSKQLSKNNGKYQQDLAAAKSREQARATQIVELKEELKMQKATYIAEVHSRLQYSKILSVIARTVEDRSDDAHLVDEVNAIVEDCENNYMSGPNGMTMDISKMKTPGRKKKRRSLGMTLGLVSPPPVGRDGESYEDETGVEAMFGNIGKGLRSIFGGGEEERENKNPQVRARGGGSGGGSGSGEDFTLHPFNEP